MIMLLFVAWGLILVGGVMILIEAFSESVFWGLGCLLLPIVSLFFVVVHWREAKKGFLIQLLGFILLAVSSRSLRSQ